MIKIVYIGNNLSAKTKYTPMLVTLSILLKKEGFELVIASSYMNKLRRLLDMVITVIKHQKATDYVLIDTFGASNFYYAVLISQIARIFRLKYIPILRGGNLPDRFEDNPYFTKLIFNYSYANVCPSKFLKVELEKKGYTAIVIPNIININNYKFKLRNKFEPKLLYVRAFHQIYNPTMAVKVLHHVQQKYPDATLCMIGPAKDKSYLETKNLAKELGVEKSIYFTGVLPKKEWNKLAENYDIFINTTTIDNTPVSVMEAMAMGLPVVSTNVGGLPYLLEDKKDAYLVPSDDAKKMSEVIIEIIEERNNVHEVVQNARKKVEKYDWTIVRSGWLNLLEKKYKKRFYNKVLEYIIVPLGDYLFNSTYIKSIKLNRKNNIFSEKELIKGQKDKLKNLLQFAVQKSPFYYNLNLDGDNPFEWLQQFPIIDKQLLKENTNSILTSDIKKLKKINSSGSSGIQSTVYMNNTEVSNLRGILTNWWEWAGYNIGDPIIQTGITPDRGFLKRLKDVFFRTTYFNAFNITEEQVLKVLRRRKLKRGKHFLVGYASSINFFAQVALKHNLKINFKAVISLGDKLFVHYRKNIEKAFGCKVFDTYGSAEGFMVASQADLNYLYIYSPQVYVEILNEENNPVKDGDMGNIIVTRLDGYSMPLIRYKLGDLGVKLPEENYPENRKFKYPLLQQIIGRDTDIIKTKLNEILIVHFFTGIFEYFPEVRQFRVIQKNLNGITIEIIKGAHYSEKIIPKIDELIKEKIFDKSFEIKYEIVGHIPATMSGKPQIIQSFL